MTIHGIQDTVDQADLDAAGELDLWSFYELSLSPRGSDDSTATDDATAVRVYCCRCYVTREGVIECEVSDG